MTKEEADLIIAEQNKSRDEILKAIEQEKCELLGIIQGKDKAIKDLEWQLKEVLEDNDNYQKENKRLEAQIEKMKCCTNCKHSRAEYKHCITDKHEKWELVE